MSWSVWQSPIGEKTHAFLGWADGEVWQYGLIGSFHILRPHPLPHALYVHYAHNPYLKSFLALHRRMTICLGFEAEVTHVFNFYLISHAAITHTDDPRFAA